MFIQKVLKHGYWVVKFSLAQQRRNIISMFNVQKNEQVTFLENSLAG